MRDEDPGRGVLAVAAALRAWGLHRDGTGTEYYSAAVRSMLESWHNFFYASFDPDGFVSVDKPPIALWIQVASARLFGFHGFSLLGPEVVEGVVAVAVLYAIVRRDFSVGAGLRAALFFALTPVSVAVDRSSNTDSCLVLVLLLAAWAREHLIVARELRFALIGDEGGFGLRPGGETANLAVAEWIRANGIIVDPALWRADVEGGAARPGRFRIAGMRLYDLRPGAGLVRPSP